MLVSTNTSYTSEVLGLMLANGGVIIAQVDFDGQTYKLDQPYTIQQQRGPQGLEAHLVPCVMTKDPKTFVAVIDKQHVMFTYPLPQEVDEAYRLQTSRLVLSR